MMMIRTPALKKKTPIGCTTLNIELQERDLKILTEIAKSPACNRSYLTFSFFDGHYEAAKKRLQLLSRAGLVQNNDRSVTGRSILRITNRGLEAIDCSHTQPGFPQIPKWMHRHELMLSDVCARLQLAAAQAGLDFEFSTDSAAFDFTVQCDEHLRLEKVRPDAFAVVRTIESGLCQYFFIETDRSTETQGHLIHLARQYREHQRSGDFAERMGNPYEPKKAPFRVLLVVKSEQRMRRTVASLNEYADIRTLFWITTLERFLKDPLAPIWQCPIDFSESTPPVSPRSLFS
jgi:hypothetical protein